MPHAAADEPSDLPDGGGDMSGGGMSPTALLLLRSEQHALFAQQPPHSSSSSSSSTQQKDDECQPHESRTPLASSDAAAAAAAAADAAAVEQDAEALAAPVTYTYAGEAAGDDTDEQNESGSGERTEAVATSPVSVADESLPRGGFSFRRSGSFSLDSSSLAFPSSPPSFTGRSESMSALAPKDAKLSNGSAGLRIFSSQADELAMKAILSPPHLRATSSTGKLADANGSGGGAPSAVSAMANGGRNALTATAAAFEATSSNLFEQGAKLLLFRGGSSSASTAAINATTVNKKSSGSIVEEDLAKLNNNILVSHPTLPPPPFANMFACDNCREDIGTLLSKGRHHCRNCGGSFCADCSTKSVVVPFQVYLARGEQRVCDGCYHRIKDFQSQAQSTQVTWSGLQPPSNDAFTQDFALSASEVPVTIFNCSLFMDFSPFYGHLFLTREHLCFKGYKGHKIKIPFAKIVSLIKPQFYYINALQVKTRRREKFFFAEFNGLRDLCFLRMDQLIRAYQEGKKQFVQVSPDDLVQQALVRRKSYKLLADGSSASTSGPKSTSFMSPPRKDRDDDLDNFLSGKSTVGYIDIDEEETDEDENEDASSSSRRGSRSTRSSVLDDDAEDKKSSASSDEEVFEPLAPDVPLQKTTVLLDCELRADVRDVFDLLWNDGIGQQFLFGTMEKARDIDILVDKWQAITKENENEVNRGFMISKENDFTLHRVVQSQHPPRTTFPGLPQYATCNRVQRFRLDKSSNGGERWDRFVVSDILRMARIPFSDYFEIETRWVFSRDGKNYCHVQAGLNVNFLKSTWFKSQINSSTRTESKEVLESWAKQAIDHLKAHEHNQRVPRSPMCRAAAVDNVDTDGLGAREGDGGESESQLGVPPRSPRSAESCRRSSSSYKPERHSTEPAAAAGGGDGALSIPLSVRQLFDAGSSPVVQWLVVLVLLYCLMLIRFQQNQIQQLTATTNALLEKLLQPQPSVSSSSAVGAGAGTGSSIQDVCQQRVLAGVSEALRQFFERA